MGHDSGNNSQKGHSGISNDHRFAHKNEDFVFEKSIFNNVFEKDIRRIFIYKKAERLAKALHLITPAFQDSTILKDKIDAIALALVAAAVLPPPVARTTLSRELLSLSSIISIARTGGLLSHMNAEIISREAHGLLQEVAGYEEPRVALEEAPTLSIISRDARKKEAMEGRIAAPALGKAKAEMTLRKEGTRAKKDISDNGAPSGERTGAVLSVIKDKGKVSIKDISTLIRGVSEKTIQRELSALVASGVVRKEGERRWSTYSLSS
jgi:DNA-binding transcriptional ArsR family regulator